MSQLLRNKKIAALGAICLLMAAAGAYAFWSAGGSGAGSAPAASAQTPLTVTQTTVLSAMYPGDSPQIVSGKFNNTNSGPIYVGTVTAAISSVVKAGGAVAGTCDATDFTLANAVATVNAEVAVGTAVGAWTGPTLNFNNKPSSQDQCKGATVNLSYTIG